MDANTWIGPSSPGGNYFYTVKEFTLPDRVREYQLNITADSYYLVYLNGKFVGRGPVRGTDNTLFFDTYPVTFFLQPGKNVIAVLFYSPERPNTIAAAVTPALNAEIPGVVKTDRSWRISKAYEWQTDVPDYTVSTGAMEYRNFRLSGGNWTLMENRTWPFAKVVKNAKLGKKQLLPRDVPFLKSRMLAAKLVGSYETGSVDAPSIDDLAAFLRDEPWRPLPAARMPEREWSGKTPLTIFGDKEGNGAVLIFDFGREFTGFLNLEVAGPAGTTVDISYGESLTGDGKIATAITPEWQLVDRYILDDKINNIGTSLYERGGKLVQVVFRNFRRKLEISRAEVEMTRYPYGHPGSFLSSDEVLNTIYANCVETIKACTMDVFVDCPWRERSFWVNDLVVENKISLLLFGPAEVHKRAFFLAFDQQLASGLLPAVCPEPEPGKFALAPTSLLVIDALHDYWLHSGDVATVRRYFPQLLKILDAFEALCGGDGLIQTPPDAWWTFYDWSFELNYYNFTGCKESMINYLYIIAVKDVLALAEAAQVGADTANLQQRVDRIREAVSNTFVVDGLLHDPVNVQKSAHISPREDFTGQTALSSQLAHALALLSGETPEKHRSSFTGALADPAGLLMPELYLHYYVLRAMAQNDLKMQALARIRNLWGKIAATGHPTVFEYGVHQFAKDGKQPFASLCHGFAIAPVEFMISYILGIRPLAPGMSEVVFDPDLLDLEFAEGKVSTPLGQISVSLRRQDGAVRVKLELPEGCVGRFGCQQLSGRNEFVLHRPQKCR